MNRTNNSRSLAPAIWRWSELAQQFDELAGLPRQDPGQRFLALAHCPAAGTMQQFPPLLAGLQPLACEERLAAAISTCDVLFHVLHGTGFSIIDGQRLDWCGGDIFVCPAGAQHEHANAADRPAMLYIIQRPFLPMQLDQADPA